MYLDFPMILVALTFATGLLWLLDMLIYRRKRDGEAKEPALFEISRSFFPVFLVVLLLRSFLIEPFRIPSASMMPTLLIGDFILVNKYAYGLRLPVLEKKVLEVGEPKRGDVVVFRFPENPRIDYIKRVIGLPGDRIDYRNKTVYVNGVALPQIPQGVYEGAGSGDRFSGYLTGAENLGDMEHAVMVHPLAPDLVPGCRILMDGSVTVPEGQYFVMGDNRDNSNDSRCWGMVPEANLRGRAVAIWMNWDWQRSGVIDWGRIGQVIK